MLTAEILKANGVLTALSDEQITAITTLSQNDENAVLGKRIGEIYTEMDKKIETITGIKRNGDEKTYLYLERAAQGLKENAGDSETLKTEIANLKSEKTRLEGLIAKGGSDEELKKQLQQVTAELETTKTQYNDVNGKLEKAKKDHETQLRNFSFDSEISKDAGGFKFKAELPQSAIEVLTSQAIAKIKGMNPDFIDNGQGGKRLVFRNKEGAVMNNPENQLNPFTAKELLMNEYKTMGILAEDRKQGGGGTGSGGNENGGGSGAISVSGARTRVEANDIITKGLLAQGLVKGSEQFDQALTKSWQDNNVAALPEK